MSVDDHMMLASGAGSVDRRLAGVIPPFRARTCEPSTATSSISSKPAARSSASSISCNRGHTPASVHSFNLRQQVTPLHPIFSAGTSRHAHWSGDEDDAPNAIRSSTGCAPGIDTDGQIWAGAVELPDPTDHREQDQQTLGEPCRKRRRHAN